MMTTKALRIAAALAACIVTNAHADTTTINLPIGSMISSLGSHFAGALSRLTRDRSTPSAAAAAPASAPAQGSAAPSARFSIAPGVWAQVTGPGPYGTQCVNVDSKSLVPAIPPGTPDSRVAKILGDAGATYLGAQFGNAGPDPSCRTRNARVHGLTAEFSAVCTQGSITKTLRMTLTMASNGRSGLLVDRSTDAMYPRVELRRTKNLPPRQGGFYANGCMADLLE